MDSIATELNTGALVIASMGPGAFTDGGHIIVLRGITDEGSYLVADPNDGDEGSSQYLRKSTTEWSPDIISGESKGFFAVRVAQ